MRQLRRPMGRRSTFQKRALQSAPSRYSLTSLSAQRAPTPGRQDLPPASKETISSDGAKPDCLVVFAFASGLGDTPNSPRLAERARARRSLQRRASFVAPGDKRPPASTTAMPFRMFDDVRKRSAPPQAPKLAAHRARSKGPSGKLAIRRERIASRNCRRLTTPLLHSLYVNQLGRALPVVKDDAQQKRVQTMFLILISPVNHA
jgi:hypothetical protein